jgi:hypothetical protein
MVSIHFSGSKWMKLCPFIFRVRPCGQETCRNTSFPGQPRQVVVIGSFGNSDASSGPGGADRGATLLPTTRGGLIGGASDLSKKTSISR